MRLHRILPGNPPLPAIIAIESVSSHLCPSSEAAKPAARLCVHVNAVVWATMCVQCPDMWSCDMQDRKRVLIEGDDSPTFGLTYPLRASGRLSRRHMHASLGRASSGNRRMGRF